MSRSITTGIDSGKLVGSSETILKVNSTITDSGGRDVKLPTSTHIHRFNSRFTGVFSGVSSGVLSGKINTKIKYNIKYNCKSKLSNKYNNKLVYKFGVSQVSKKFV